MFFGIGIGIGRQRFITNETPPLPEFANIQWQLVTTNWNLINTTYN
jgi:hypothetical protein